MGIELRDFRVKLHAETMCVLEAEAQSTGDEMGEVVRAILKTWADKRLHSASLLQQALHREGLEGIVAATRRGKA